MTTQGVKLLLSLSLSGSILATLVYVVKLVDRGKLAKSAQYYVWVVVLLRLLLPISPQASAMNSIFYRDIPHQDVAQANPTAPEQREASVSIGGDALKSSHSSVMWDVVELLLYGDVDSISRLSADLAVLDVDHLTAEVAGQVDQDYPNASGQHLGRWDLLAGYFLPVWVLGALAFFLTNMRAYWRFTRILKSTNRPATAEENRLLASLPGGGRVGLARNSFVSGPVLVGLVKPCIIIPDGVYSQDQLRHILLHELVHYRHWDIAIKHLALLAAAVHWFNPLVHLIRNEVDNACELACDEAVLCRLKPEARRAYGSTLLSVAAAPTGLGTSLQATMALNAYADSFRHRLVAIRDYSGRQRKATLLSLLVLTIFVAGALSLGAGVGYSKDPVPVKSETIASRGDEYVLHLRYEESEYVLHFRHGQSNSVRIYFD